MRIKFDIKIKLNIIIRNEIEEKKLKETKFYIKKWNYMLVIKSEKKSISKMKKKIKRVRNTLDIKSN